MPIEVFTERGMIRTVAERWLKQYRGYERDPAWPLRDVGERLAALDLETATKEQVDAIIGNSSWTNIHCDNCGQRGLKAGVQVGQTADYESATAVLCLECCERATTALRGARA